MWYFVAPDGLRSAGVLSPDVRGGLVSPGDVGVRKEWAVNERLANNFEEYEKSWEELKRLAEAEREHGDFGSLGRAWQPNAGEQSRRREAQPAERRLGDTVGAQGAERVGRNHSHRKSGVEQNTLDAYFQSRYGAGKTVAEAVREAKANQEAEQEEPQKNQQDTPPFPENGIAR